MNSCERESMMICFARGLASATAVLAFATGCSPTVNENISQLRTESTGQTPVAKTLDLSQAFSTGYYTDYDATALPLTSICSSKSLFGIAGTAVCQSATATTPAGAADVLLGKEYWDDTGTKITGTMPIGADISGANGSATFLITQGYYDGSKTCTASDSDLVAGNIANGVTIFGVTGNAGLESHSNCTAANQSSCIANASYPTQSTPITPAVTADVLTGKQFFVGGAMQTGSMTNQGALDAGASFPGEGYYNGTVTNPPNPADILAGKTILGVAGSAAFPDLFHSHAYRNDNSSSSLANLQNGAWVSARTRASLRQELTNAAAYTTNHRLVPDPQYDTDGWADNTGIGTARLNHLRTIQGGRPSTVCGSSGTIDERITDCSNQNGSRASWDGTKYGKQGEGEWSLVTLVNDGARNWEVWRDERTKLLWSDATIHLGDDQQWGGAGASTDLGNGYNWFQAAGYASSASTLSLTGVEGGTPTGTGKAYVASCTNSGTETCQPDVAVSVCADATLLAGINGVASYSTPVAEDFAKGQLGQLSTPNVKWRLPTRSDWYLAEANGIRFVLPNMEQAHWTSTSRSYDRNQALQYSGIYGNASDDWRYLLRAVRCIGTYN